MPETFIFIALITVGVIVALQGIQTMRGRYKPRANIVERAFVSTLELNDYRLKPVGFKIQVTESDVQA